MKCAQGMTFDVENNACQGDANTFQYCDAQDNSCNGGVNEGVLDGAGNSQVWATCNDLEFAGYTDWRVPLKNELKGLIHCSSGHVVGGHPASCEDGAGYTSPAIDTRLFSDFPAISFWSSSAWSDDSRYAWDVYFHEGAIYQDLKTATSTFGALCVRSGNSQEENWQLDPSFGGGNGYIHTADPGGYVTAYDCPYDVVVDDNDKILITGETHFDNSDNVAMAMVLARYNTNGDLDTTFGGGDGLVVEHELLSSNGYDKGKRV